MDGIWLHISRLLANEAGTEDQRKVTEWLNTDSKHGKVFKNLNVIWNSGPQSFPQLPQLYQKVIGRIPYVDPGFRKKRLRIKYLSIAAGILLLLFLNLGTWFYFLGPEKEAEKGLTFHSVMVPKGSRTEIILPDSTKVWLSNDSKLVFPGKFPEHSREVELTGNAYFEVRHNRNKPFWVKTREGRIKVLGTSFAVSAYPGDRFIETSLIEGKVIFEAGNLSEELAPGVSLIYDKKQNHVNRKEIDPSFFEYWKNGSYHFRNETLQSLSDKIYRIYNIRIVFENESLKQRTFTGTVSVHDNIFTFMETIKRISIQPVDYFFDYKKNTIYLKYVRE
jgi:transmembrane sensor